MGFPSTVCCEQGFHIGLVHGNDERNFWPCFCGAKWGDVNNARSLGKTVWGVVNKSENRCAAIPDCRRPGWGSGGGFFAGGFAFEVAGAAVAFLDFVGLLTHGGLLSLYRDG